MARFARSHEAETSTRHGCAARAVHPRAVRWLAASGAALVLACGTDDTSTGPAGESFNITVLNDLPRPVKLEYCPKQRCADAERLVIAAGESHSYPRIEVAADESVDLIRIVDGRRTYCLLAPPLEKDERAGEFLVKLSTFRGKCD